MRRGTSDHNYRKRIERLFRNRSLKLLSQRRLLPLPNSGDSSISTHLYRDSESFKKCYIPFPHNLILNYLSYSYSYNAIKLIAYVLSKSTQGLRGKLPSVIHFVNKVAVTYILEHSQNRMTYSQFHVTYVTSDFCISSKFFYTIL